MSFVESYTISGDFALGLDSSILHQQILDSSEVTATLVGICVDGDDVDIIFSTDPAAELADLNAIVASHDPNCCPQNDLILLTEAFLNANLLTNELLSGHVSWDSGLTFNVSAISYMLNNLLRNSTGGTVVLDPAANGTDRTDIIFVNEDGFVGKKTGTPGDPPLKPGLLTSEFELLAVDVPSNATVPNGILENMIYDENIGLTGEWEATVDTTFGTIDPDDTSDAFAGTKSIKFTDVSQGDKLILNLTQGKDIAGLDLLEFYIKSAGEWIGENIAIYFHNDGELSGIPVNFQQTLFGFNSANIDDWQRIAINLKQFNFSSLQVDELIFEVANGTIGFSLDRIRFQEGIEQPQQAVGETNTALNVNVGGVGVFKQKSGVALEFKGIAAGSSAVTITNDTTFNQIDIDLDLASVDHNSLDNLTVGDPHTQYLLKDGRDGGQTIIGGLGATEDLTLQSNSSGTAGSILAADNLVIQSGNQLLLQEQIVNGTEFVGIEAPDDVVSSYVLKLPTSVGTDGYFLKADGTDGSLVWTPGGAVGESNTASNVNAGGVGVFKQKNGIDLEFRGINAATNAVSVTLDAGNDEIDIGLILANISHDELLGSGTNTHAQIDAHIASTSNPHLVTAQQVGLGLVSNVLNNLSATTNPTVNDDVNDTYSIGSIWVNTNTDQAYILTDNTAGAAVWIETTAGAAGGEINNGTNLGDVADGEAVFVQKTGVDFEFRRITNATDNFVDVSNNGTAITIAVLVGNISHDQLIGTGTYSHDSIDMHINDVTTNPHNVTKSQVGLGDVENILNNYAGTTAPNATEDSSVGYDIGSVWVDTVNDMAYVCTDNTPFSAVWVETTAGAAGGEINNGTNLGNIGEGIFVQKNGVTFEFRNITNSSQNTVTVANNGTEVTLGLVLGNISHDALLGSGFYSHDSIDAHINSTENPHGVTAEQLGLGNVGNTLNNFSATGPPTVTNDTDEGYAVGSVWVDTTNDDVYTLVDNTDGAAVWVQTSALNGTNVGTAGVGVFKHTNNGVYEFKKINAGSSKITVTDDTGNDEIDIDVDTSSLDHGEMAGLLDDDHTQYALLNGRTSGQTLSGRDNGVGSGGLTLRSKFGSNVESEDITIEGNLVINNAFGRELLSGVDLRLMDGAANHVDLIVPNPITNSYNIRFPGYGSSEDTVLVATDTDGTLVWSDLNRFGSVHDKVINDTQQSTTSEVFQSKVVLNSILLPAAEYRVSWNYQWSYNHRSSRFNARLVLDGDTANPLMEHSQRAPENSLSQEMPGSGFTYVTFATNDTHVLDLQIRSEQGGRTSSIENTRIEIMRVS